MKEMWDYENGTMGPEKRKRDSNPSQKGSIVPQMPQFINCELCGGSHNHADCLHESQFSQLGEDTCAPNSGFNIQGRKIKQPIQRRPHKGQLSLWRPNYPLKKKQAVARVKLQKNKLTTEKVSEIGQEQDQSDLSQQQMVVDKKTEVWVDEQN